MTVHTTYFGGLGSHVEPADDALVLGVVRYPKEFIQRVTDRNVTAVAPPDDLLDAFKTVEAAADRDDVATPSSVAWDTVDFEARYRAHLEGRKQQKVVSELRDRLAHCDVWLVCWEKNPRYCHRRVLAEVLLEECEATPVHHPDLTEFDDPNDEQAGHDVARLTEFTGGTTV